MVSKEQDIKNYPYVNREFRDGYYRTYVQARNDAVKEGIRWLYKLSEKSIENGAYWYMRINHRSKRDGEYLYDIIRGYREWNPKTKKYDMVEFASTRNYNPVMTKEEAMKFLKSK